jgi:hypothetical protein
MAAIYLVIPAILKSSRLPVGARAWPGCDSGQSSEILRTQHLSFEIGSFSSDTSMPPTLTTDTVQLPAGAADRLDHV